MDTNCTKYKILNRTPGSWQDLQVKTAQIFSDMGYNCEVEKDIETVRGIVNIDVYCLKLNDSSAPNQTILIECKNWRKKVPKSVVHGFRTVVGDSGANLGIIISKMGFQEGAIIAAEKSNVLLFSWDEFLEHFKVQWIHAIINSVHISGMPLVHFTDYMGDFYDEELRKLNSIKQNKFLTLMKKYAQFAWYCSKSYYLNHLTGAIDYLDNAIDERKNKIPVNVECYADYFYFVRDYCVEGLNEFDNLFGKKVRKN